MSNQYLSFDVTKQSTPQQLITGRQGDSQLKFVTMLFWDGDKNVPYDLTGKQVAFEALKPDNTHIVDYEGITVLNATAGLVRYSFNEQVFSVAGTMQQAFFKITHTDKDDQVIADSTLEINIHILENRVEFGINSTDYLSEYDDLIAKVKQKFDDYAATVQDSIDKANALHDQIVEYTNLINSKGVVLISEFGDAKGLRYPIGNNFVEKLNNEIFDRGVNVAWFGAKGDGNTDDTTAIQSAIDSLKNGDTLFFEKNKIYKIAGINLHNLNNVKIFGNNSTLSITDGTDNFAFQYTGKNSEIELAYFKIVGNMAGGKITAIGCHSGQDLTYSNIHDLTIDRVNVGISLNAETAGTIAFNNVFNNHLTNIIGSEPGSGYGIHVANANFNDIHDNIIDHAQRHSIYHAFGDNNDIHHNKLLNHRADIDEGVGRAALQILRSSSNVRVYDNRFINCYDGCIIMNTLNELGDMLNIDIHHNNFISTQGPVPVVRVGGDETKLVHNMFNIKIHQNNFQNCDLPTAIRIDSGIEVFVKDNNLDYLNLSDRVNGMLIAPTISGALDRVFISNNIFRINGSNYQEFRGIYFGGLVPTDSNIHITAHDNLFPTIYSDIEKKFSDYSASATITNPNLFFRNDMKRTAEPSTTPPAKGFYPLGSLCWSSNPNSTGCVGWVCVVGGAPGTWSKFGTLP